MAETHKRSNAPGLAAALLILLLLPHAGCTRSDASPRMLLLISVDTLRADHLGTYGNDLGLTPRLDELAASSLVFDSAYAPTSFTLPSVSSLLTGRYPEEIGILGNRSALAPEVPTLASSLRERGWRTAAVVSNLVLRKNAGLATGFDSYDDSLPSAEAAREWPERIAADTTDAAIDVIEGLSGGEDERLFLWVHYQDPHGPYTPPEGLRERFLAAERSRPDGPRRLTPGVGRGLRGRLPDYQVVDDRREVAFYRAGYDAEVHYLDAELGRLLDFLTARGLMEASVVVVTADHGESLGERDYWFAHGERLDDALVRVPLLLRVPGVAPGRRRDVAGLVDLHPTLLRLLTSTGPPDENPGRDLLAPGADSRDSTLYLATLGGNRPARFGIIEAGHKFVVVQGARRHREELFRIGEEGRDLIRSDPERAERMRRSLDDLRAKVLSGRREHRQRLTDEDVRKLRALGYVEDGDPDLPEPD